MKTHFTNSHVILGLLLILIVTSCATPQAVIRMNPTSDDVRWNYGQAFSSDTVNGIIVEAAFYKADKQYNIMDVSVINGSNMDYLVDPSQFFFEDVTTGTDSQTIKAIDPEYMLLRLDKKIAQDEADSKNAAVGLAVATGVLATAAVVTAVATADDDNHHHYRSPDPDLIISAPLVIDATDNAPREYASETDRQINMWANSSIRKTTLTPGYKVEGKLYFHRFEKPGKYMLKVPVDNEYIEIPFIQLNL